MLTPRPKQLSLILLSTLLAGCQTLDSANAGRNADIDPAFQSAAAKDSPAKIIEKNAAYEKSKALMAEANTIWAKAEYQALSSDDYDALAGIYEQLKAIDPANARVTDGMQAMAQQQRHQTLINEANALMLSEDTVPQAMENVRHVLLENPNNASALRLYQTLSQKQAAKTKARTKLKLEFNEPITMDFRDVEIKKMFEALAKTTGVNFVIDKDVDSTEKATIFINSMPFNDALDLILHTNELNKKIISDKAVIIYGKYGERSYTDLSVRTYNLDYADAKVMQGILKSMLNLKKVQVDPRLNTLLIKDSPEKLALAEQLILAQDKPDAEVMLDMQVLEVSRTYTQNLGVNTPTGLSVPVPASGNLTASDVGNVTSGVLVVNGVPGFQFDASNGNVNILANPRIRVRNKHLAKIHIGEKVPVFTAVAAATGVTTQNVQYIDAGLKLEVEPTISASNDVNIKLTFNVGSIGAPVTSGDSTAFRVGTRFTTTELRLHDGETQILAGLINDQDTKNISGIPGLKDMPLLGKLFSVDSDSKTKTEILLSITPHIVRTTTPYASNEADIWIGSDKRKGVASPSPQFQNGVTPFFVPKPPQSKPQANGNGNGGAQLPPGLNLQLPPGFSLGGGLNSGNLEAPPVPIDQVPPQGQ